MKKIVKHAGGRPTKYKPKEIFQKIEEYLSMCGREQTSLPTVEGMAIKLGVTTETVYQWAKKYPKFSDTIKKILQKQKQQLMDDGMYGGKEVNAAMAIFLLKVNHGMKDTAAVNIHGDKVIAILGGASVHSDKSDQKVIEAEQED